MDLFLVMLGWLLAFAALGGGCAFFSAAEKVTCIVKGPGERIVRTGFKLFGFWAMGLVVSILTLIIPMVGVLAIIVTCVLGGACLIFAPFGLLWIAFRVRSLAQRVAELESLDATLSAAQAPNLVQL